MVYTKSRLAVARPEATTASAFVCKAAFAITAEREARERDQRERRERDAARPSVRTQPRE